MENNFQPIKQPLMAALYGRVSTGRQENEATIESQVDEVKARIEADGNVLPQNNIFVDDGWTGEMLQRPALDAMRDAGMVGQFQALYVYDRGRLARKFAYQEIVIEELTDRNIQFVTLHDVNAVTPEEHVLQAMQGVFHEYERIKIAERMRRGKLFKARNGIVINGQAPFGYNYVKKTETTPTHFEVNEEEAEIVRKIFHWIGVERVSLNNVIKRLYDLGIKPRRRKSDFWTKGPILRMMRNEAYSKGLIYYNKSEAVAAKKSLKHDKYKKVKRNSKRDRPREDWIPFKVAPLIADDGLYEKVREVLDHNQRFTHSQKQQRFNYLLTGYIYCGCGQRRAGDGSSKYGHFYYRCVSRIHKPSGVVGTCMAQGVNAAIVDGLFWRELQKYLTDKDYLRKQAEDWLVSEMNQNQVTVQEKEKLTEQMTKAKEEQSRYAKAYGAGSLDFDQFQELMKESKKKVGGWKTRLGGLIEEIDGVTVNSEQLDLLCEEAKKVVETIDFSDQKKLIGDIIDKITVHETGRVETLGHLPLFAHKLGQQNEDFQGVGLYAASRNCRSSKRGKVNTV